MNNSEPTQNIGESNGIPTEFNTEQPTTVAEEVVNRLGTIYWQKNYGGQDAFVCLIRTVLSQNTNDKASHSAFESMLSQFTSSREIPPEDHRISDPNDFLVALGNANENEIAESIRDAGLYNQKATVIVELANIILDEYGTTDEFSAFVRTAPGSQVREALLEMKGVGPKTADCVLLFAGGRDGVMPVDTHIHRIYRRLGIAASGASHEDVRVTLENLIPAEKCGTAHTTSIQFGREYCTSRKPICLDTPSACPLLDLCDRVGINNETGEVLDPAETTQ